jgi:hypothetical protein
VAKKKAAWNPNAVWLSYSGASAFKACPEKFYLSKDWKAKGNPAYFPFGSAIECGVTVAIEERNREKMIAAFVRNWQAEKADNPEQSKPVFDNWEVEYSAGDVDLDIFDEEETIRLDQWATEIYDDETRTWQTEIFRIFGLIKEKQKLNAEDDKFYKRCAWLSMKKKGEIMLNSFFDGDLKKIKGLVEIDGKPAAQIRIDIPSDTGDNILGFVDYIVELTDGTIMILDCKTAAAEYPDHKILTSEQLKVYAVALEQKLGFIPEIGYLVLLKKLEITKACDACGAVRENSKLQNCVACGKGKYTKKSFKGGSQFIRRKVKEDELDDQLDDYSQVADAIRNKVRYKNPENCFAFGRQCEFYNYCHHKKPLKELKTIEPKKKG